MKNFNFLKNFLTLIRQIRSLNFSRKQIFYKNKNYKTFLKKLKKYYLIEIKETSYLMYCVNKLLNLQNLNES